MKKVVLSVGMLFSFYFSNAQDLKLKNEFGKQRLENEKKLDSFLSKSAKYSSKEKDSLKKNLAGFAGQIPLFYSTEETRANATANIDELQSGSVSGAAAVTGSGVKITIFDAGRIQDTHEQFTTNRAVNREAATEAKHYHGTNVNSILIGNGTATGTFTQSGSTYSKLDAKGILPQGITDNYMFAATALGNNYQKLATLPDLNISNHSYGVNLGWLQSGSSYYWYGNYEFSHQDTYSGAYYENDYNFDKIVYAQPQQIIVKSTGNYYGVGPSAASPKYKFNTATNSWVAFAAGDEIPPANCSQGYNCIGYGSVAKNIIVVGAVNQLTTSDHKYTQANDVVKGSFSGAGPRKDGAVKPDITAVGVDMIMANYTNANPNATTQYVVNYGTSYAAPMVTGIAGALTQIQRGILGNSSFIFKADEMKALLTHTANEAGRPGPDVWYGWGLVDAKKAAKVLINKLNEDSYLERNTLQSTVDFTKEIKASGTEPLKVSISWVDPAIAYFTTDIDQQQNHTSRLVNDLDLRVVEVGSGTVYYPWKLDINDPNANATKGDNTVDNVEQIVIDNPAAGGIYRIEVSHKNTLVNQEGNAATQDFALVATGTKKITLASENISKDEVKIYPTKTKDLININAPNDIERIALFDMNGKLILENLKASKSQTISLNKLPNSVYILTVKTKTGIVSKKIVKE
ncbi:S8 family serine peptidase [Epilithonimonas sp. JDS]|uniref:S8 family peptidase n=1 Tax=Epilithonimonas sp. JDS TaxID=2902797 RepID=UPI001E5F9F1D|nr:S8 family peptidase [Epilithonimonas sp. JDS]MCD9856369.1 S8 family serine peptidase [Epilithonimonas sp. JDS]